MVCVRVICVSLWSVCQWEAGGGVLRDQCYQCCCAHLCSEGISLNAVQQQQQEHCICLREEDQFRQGPVAVCTRGLVEEGAKGAVAQPV